MSQRYYLKGLNMLLTASWLLTASLFLIANMAGAHIGGFTHFVSIQLIIFLIVAAGLLLPKCKPLHLRKYALGLCFGLLTVIILALYGFYGRSAPSPDGNGYVYYNGGSSDVWVSSHSLGVALESSVLDPATFVSKLFNDCNEYRSIDIAGSACTNDHYLVGVLVCELVLIGSVVSGNVATKRSGNKGMAK